GCGDVGTRLARLLAAAHRPDRIRTIGVVRREDSAAALRSVGIGVLQADLSARSTLRRLRGLAHWMTMLAPPPADGARDLHSRRLIAALSTDTPERRKPQVTLATGRARLTRASPGRRAAAYSRRWVYVSTTGVYGDAGGARLDETRIAQPSSARARRRVDGEQVFRRAARIALARVAIARAPGIYAQDRLPTERLARGLPALRAQDDVYTNHIHALDLARICWLALFKSQTSRVYNAVDDNELKMGDYFDLVADATGLSRPPRVARAELPDLVSPMMLSFMRESRRISNRRLHQEMRIKLRYPLVSSTLAQLRESSL
ncbi:MAG: SDR family NAD(P)-dependent oxidoreductase, partial [Quisquiliibacterium sp.]